MGKLGIKAWTVGDYVGLAGGIVGFASALFAFFSWQEARVSNDRVSGNIKAVFDVVGIYPKAEQIPQRMKAAISSGREVARIHSLDRLRMLNPYVLVKNTGSNSIDGFRLETRANMIVLHDPAKQISDDENVLVRNAWTISQAEREDYALPRKLEPGESARIPLVSGLLTQILNNQDEKSKNQFLFGLFQVTVYAKLVGLDSFDEDRGRSAVLLSLAWLPEGFDEEKCRAFLGGWKRIAEIKEDREARFLAPVASDGVQ